MDGPISRCGFRAIDYAGKARFCELGPSFSSKCLCLGQEQFRWPNEEASFFSELATVATQCASMTSIQVEIADYLRSIESAVNLSESQMRMRWYASNRRSMGSNYTWWGACFSGDIQRIDEYLQNGQETAI